MGLCCCGTDVDGRSADSGAIVESTCRGVVCVGNEEGGGDYECAANLRWRWRRQDRIDSKGRCERGGYMTSMTNDTVKLH